MKQNIIFEARQLKKAFGPVLALKGVDFSVRRGEIRGLIGENGSGKSTIMSIAAGMQPPSGGAMTFLGRSWHPRSMVEAQQAGLAMILQEANTIPHVSVAQNLFAGREQDFAAAGFISMRRMVKAANQMLDTFQISHIRGGDPIDRLSFEDRKLIEIVRCVTTDTQLLVVDETTTALSHEGRRILYALIHRMAEEENKAVVFISHDMDEILTECSALTVLRDGEIIGHLDQAEMRASGASEQIRRMMVGRDIGSRYYRESFEPAVPGPVALEMRDICIGPIRHFNLRLHDAEIVALGGLSGCGMHLLARLAYGLEKPDSGQVLCGGAPVKSCLGAIKSGIGYISKDRDAEALILNASIQANITLPSLDALTRRGYIRPRDERALAEEQIRAFSIKCGGADQWVSTLSGGNKQKVSFSKWTAMNSHVIIMDCPTRGVDVGVKQAMYALIEQMRAAGKAILMVSEELPELIGMADRLIIMKDFAVTKEFVRSKDLKQTDIIEYMI